MEGPHLFTGRILTATQGANVIKKFIFTGEVHRVVVDTITVAIFADEREEAAHKARVVLETFPKAQSIEGANYCYVENREQIDSELLSLKDEKDKEWA